MKTIKVALLQTNPSIGDIAGNANRILELYREAVAGGARLAVAPESALIGYPAMDLLLRADVLAAQNEVLDRLREECATVPLVIGIVQRNTGSGKPLRNVAVLIRDRRISEVSIKANLPFYGEFNEPRYFEPGTGVPAVFRVDGVRCAVLVCEDLWARANERDQGGKPLYTRNLVEELAGRGVELVVSVNGSPYHQGKSVVRETVARDVAGYLNASVVYVNRVGGQDELVFDGGSFAMAPDGQYFTPPERFVEGVRITNVGGKSRFVPLQETIADLYNALVLSVRDYARRNGFRSAVLGLSGGVDSALTLAVAVDALGAENVYAVMMPFAYTAPESIADAREEAEALGVGFTVRPIAPGYEAFMGILAEDFAGRPRDVTEENLQARIRGIILMSLSNKLGHLVLTTGNKSEMSVGYATLYGDMAGGFAVLKDVWKGLVYALSRYRNTIGRVIPERVLTREPSAELAPDQKDRDSLPPYDVLDAILALLIEEVKSVEEIVALGYDGEMVRLVARMVDRAEYKRRQAPPGPKVTRRALSPDGGRMMPITHA